MIDFANHYPACLDIGTTLASFLNAWFLSLSSSRLFSIMDLNINSVIVPSAKAVIINAGNTIAKQK